MLASQLALSLNSKDESTFENYYCGNNAEIISGLKKTARGDGERFIYLCGGLSHGCSHLLQAACHEASSCQRTSVYLPLGELTAFSPELLTGLEVMQLVCLDDVEAIATKREWEEAVFHLYNRVFDAGGRMVIAAHVKPRQTNIGLPDLVSRLTHGVIYQLMPLDDQEKISALQIRAAHRGMVLPEEVGNYLLTHYPRNMGRLFDVLDTLDKASLAAKRRLTVPFVKEVLQL